MRLQVEILALTMILLAAWPSDGTPPCLLDLTHDLNNDTLSFTLVGPFTTLNRRNVTIGNVTFQIAEFHGSEQHGTHMDAPLHFNPNGFSIANIPIQNLEGPAVVITITDRAELNPDAQVTVQDLKDWEKKYGRIPDNSIIIMNSGYSKYYWTNSTKYNGAPLGQLKDQHFPSFGKEACKWLLKERSFVGVGVDTLSVDIADYKFECHILLSAKNKFIIENLANVDQLPACGAYIRASPMKITGGSGSPTRVFATLPIPKD